MFRLNRPNWTLSGQLGLNIKKILEESKAAGTYKTERVIVSAQGSDIKIPSVSKNSPLRTVSNFCANNYLGLSNHPALISAAKATLDSHGFGLSSVRFICGTQDIHKELEHRIAEFHGKEAAILYPSCFDANTGFFEAILGPNDAIFSDELNHASIIDGIRLCRAGTKQRYRHLDYADLEEKIARSVDTGPADQVRLIVTDGVFSMDGDIARLDKLHAIKSKFPNTYLFVDECHATGLLGHGGKGTPGIFNVQPDVINSTLGKALGGATGGYTAASHEIVDLLRQRARPYLFSNTVAPSVVGASLKVLDIVEGKDSGTSGTELQGKLAANTLYFRKSMVDAGFAVLGNDACPIVPVLIGDAKTSAEVAEGLLDRGIYVVSFSYPVVPKDQARIRVQISASHTKAQLSKAVAGFISVGKEFGILQLYTSAAFDKHTETGRRLAQQEDAGEWDDILKKS